MEMAWPAVALIFLWLGEMVLVALPTWGFCHPTGLPVVAMETIVLGGGGWSGWVGG